MRKLEKCNTQFSFCKTIMVNVLLNNIPNGMQFKGLKVMAKSINLSMASNGL